MQGPADVGKDVGPMIEQDIKIETHCHVCRGEFKEGIPIIRSRCGVYYHEECAKRVVNCAACGENLLEHFMGEEPKRKRMNKDRLFTILTIVLPFAVLELLFALWSIISHPSGWSVPPWGSVVFLVTLIVFIAGILILISIYMWYGYKPEKRTIDSIILVQKGVAPGVPDSMLYTCGYGDRAAPNELGEVAIPNKKGVQRENIVRIRVDRVTMTPNETFIWSNPKFLKILNPNKNPQPSDNKDLEEVWKASGRVKIIPAEQPEAEAEKLCSVCGRPLDYISEYDAWYCIACGRYEEIGQAQAPRAGPSEYYGPPPP